MKYRKVSIPIAVLIVAALTFSCSDDPAGPEGTGVGVLEVWLNVTGDAADPDGFTVSLDDALQEPIPAGETVQFAEVDAGDHTVMLSSVASYCSLSGENPRTVSITASQTTATQFDVLCGSAVVSPDVAGMDILGIGYNGFGNYADVIEVRAHVLDLEALAKDVLVERVQYERATFQVSHGASRTSFGPGASTVLQVVLYLPNPAAPSPTGSS